MHVEVVFVRVQEVGFRIHVVCLSLETNRVGNI
jgi:hypothetical protein